MATQHVRLYRDILRELKRAAVPPRRTNKMVASNFRALVEKSRHSADKQISQDLEHALLFLRSARLHKLLLERYNPLIDLTSQERVKATARRVGLDMPVAPKTE